MGYLPEAVLNFITFCGSGFDDNRKIRRLDELVDEVNYSALTWVGTDLVQLMSDKNLLLAKFNL